MSSLAPFNVAADLWSIVRPRTGPQEVLEAIHAAARTLRALDDASLRSAADRLRAPARSRMDLTRDEVLAPAFALVLESTRRVHGIALFDTQLLAGMAMARGAIAEMATGEGKTLAAALPAMLFSLRDAGVHVATPNAYLAQRDFQRVGPVLQLLGVSVGLVPECDCTPLDPRAGVAPAGPAEYANAKRAAYACDVAYATGYELGFDYLRDQLQVISARRTGLGEGPLELLRGLPSRQPLFVQPRRGCAIIDEIDSVLIDEACLPLVLSDGSESAGRQAAYLEARRLAASLRAGDDFEIDSRARSVALTRAGRQSVYEHYLGRFRFPLNRPWAEYVVQALASQYLYQRDVDYVVQDGRVLLVDEFTGRIFAQRTWRDGLHQAVEAKEGLLTSPEARTAARISRQRFFRLYETICGMTGTASGSRRADLIGTWHRHFRLAVLPVPLQKPSRRETWPSRFFIDAESKSRAVAAEVVALHRAGRPVLIGSRTIRNSQLLAERLAGEGLPLELLNGRQDRAEAEIIARAGRRGAVTIATNMAGRGTDIVLGPGVAELGGMHVIGLECHESGRIDRQLLGRAGRQGDPGSGRFFISADDPLLLRFAPALSRRMRRMPGQEGEIHVDLSGDVLVAQRAAEAASFAARRRMLVHDRWMDEMATMVG
jgi:preprotein translocase subunit SecA